MKRFKLTSFICLIGFFYLFTSVNNLYAQDVQQAFKSSYTAENNKDYASAITSLRRVYSNTYEMNLRLGWLYYLDGKYQESISYYEKCIQQMPMSIEARLGYVQPAYALEKWNDMLNQYLAILQIDPNHSKANYQTGVAYYYRKDYPRAEKYLQKVLNMYPFDYYSLLMLGWTKFNLGKRNEAKVLFNKVLLYAPDDTSAKEGLSLIR
ncbi:MAG: tetratricopeptide repeat protein [Bacteroidetes Order II. Incertae sedis bacterium]|nr:tetratricopeptide repeat protein [Bacteroidetes Order II. bacterium]